MSERVSTLNGSIDIVSTPQQGTLVSVSIPLHLAWLIQTLYLIWEE